MTPAEVLLAYDPNDVKPGWIALVLVLVLALATFLLWRSMNTQLGRIKAPHRADLGPADSADLCRRELRRRVGDTARRASGRVGTRARRRGTATLSARTRAHGEDGNLPHRHAHGEGQQRCEHVVVGIEGRVDHPVGEVDRQ